MSKEERSPCVVVDFEDNNKLSNDIKQAIISLVNHSNTQYRLHVCLNGADGYTALQELISNPDTKIRAILMCQLVMDRSDLWINTKLLVFVGKCSSDKMAMLSPQQTGCLARSLPDDSKTLFLNQVKVWYRNSFLKDIKSGLATVTEQVENGDLLLENDHQNHVFDIHGGRPLNDIPYTETEIVGNNLFWAVVFGGTCFEHGSDGYDRADRLINSRLSRQKVAVDDVLGLLRQIQH